LAMAEDGLGFTLMAGGVCWFGSAQKNNYCHFISFVQWGDDIIFCCQIRWASLRKKSSIPQTLPL
jgi:hypothetical protein